LEEEQMKIIASNGEESLDPILLLLEDNFRANNKLEEDGVDISKSSTTNDDDDNKVQQQQQQSRKRENKEIKGDGKNVDLKKKKTVKDSGRKKPKLTRGKNACPEHKRKHLRCPEDCKMRIYSSKDPEIRIRKKGNQKTNIATSIAKLAAHINQNTVPRKRGRPCKNISNENEGINGNSHLSTLSSSSNEKSNSWRREEMIMDGVNDDNWNELDRDNTEYIDIDEFTIVASSHRIRVGN
jgi:hypothetical protein